MVGGRLVFHDGQNMLHAAISPPDLADCMALNPAVKSPLAIRDNNAVIDKWDLTVYCHPERGLFGFTINIRGFKILDPFENRFNCPFIQVKRKLLTTLEVNYTKERG